MTAIQLVVQADDFGMCHAVNRGIVEAFREGVVTQASVMAPCPWLGEAAALAHEHALPVGMHCTLTCEWDHLRWRPLTGGASLTEADGTLHRTVQGGRARAVAAEATQELRAQAELLRHFDLEIRYLDFHMGPVCMEAYETLCRELDLRFVYPPVAPNHGLDSYTMLSPREADEKAAWFRDYLQGLQPGRHLIITHPAVASAELRALAGPGAENTPWAEAYRVSDLALLTSEEAREIIEGRGIELVSLAQLDVR